MNSKPELERAIDKARRDFASQTIVCIAAANDLEGHVGSAVLLRTKKGEPFLLTARHTLLDDLPPPDGWKPLTVLVPTLGPEGADIRDAGTSLHLFPPLPFADRIVDVAVVRLDPWLHDALRPLAASIDQVAVEDAVSDTDVVFTVGFPNALAFEDPTLPKRYMVSTVTLVTGIKGHDKHGRLEVEWGEAVVGEGNRAYPKGVGRDDLLQFREGAQIRLPHPGGISGGAVWRLPEAKAAEIWSPSTHAQLIGMTVAYNERSTEYAESSTTFGPWLHKLSAEFDGEGT
jgi:hypothetical protein